MWGVIAKLVGRFAVEPINTKPMPVVPPKISKIPLKENQYYPTVYPKKYIFLHHTAGGSAASSVAHWASNPEHIATPYIIDRDGTIYECYDPKYWAYHLGVKGVSSIEKYSIGIEICSYGSLAIAKNSKPDKYKVGDMVTYTDRVIQPEKVVKIAPFRAGINPFAQKPGLSYDSTLFEAYTPEQIASLALLIPYLMGLHGIKLQADRKDFWEYKNPTTLPPGIYSHTTVRKDKIDIFPQKELVEMIYSLP